MHLNNLQPASQFLLNIGSPIFRYSYVKYAGTYHQDLHAKQIVVFCSDHGGDTWDRDAKESAAGFHGRHHAHGGEQRDRHAYRARSRLLRFSIAITRILRQVYLFNTLKYNVSGTDCHI